jgi:probable F420-dependent oxidoreductase
LRWTTETGRDPFLPLLLAAEHAPGMSVGTAVAVAFARSPMTLAHTAYDVHALSSGRFVLGLGSQVRAHVTRRFGMPWSAPAARMREFVVALRAIWHAWQHDVRLYFKGEFYSHTLMPPLSGRRRTRGAPRRSCWPRSAPG